MEAVGVVFLPAAGRRVGSNVGFVEERGFYYSSTARQNYNVFGLSFYSGIINLVDGQVGNINRTHGCSVRLAVDAN